ESPGEPYDKKDNDDDGMIDESMQDDIDNDGDWDPEIDDVGADGISGDVNRNSIQDGNEEWDEGEGDGYPTHGEPNFDEKDLDEADQIGLTSFAVYEYGTLYPNQDEACWNLLVAGVFDTAFGQTSDNVFQYGSGPIIMAPGDERRFSITLFFGYDKNDLFRSAETVQKIYNEGYRFTKAPEKPTVKAVAGDGRVTLYWDDFAESSRDPIQGYDFAGYNIYRGTDHGISDAFVVTDAQGNPTMYKPIAQFNTAGDGWYGTHPVETENGIHFYMGDDDVAGLKHSWTDTTVTNGQTYYYAVVSFDHGDSTEIPPTECTWDFEEYPAFSGDYFATVNTAIVIPQAAATGYRAPALEGGFVEHEGPATGSIKVGFLDPSEVQEQNEYRIVFDDSSSSDTTFSLWNNSVRVSELLPVSIRWQYVAWDESQTPPEPTDSVQITTINMSNANIIANDQFHLFNADSSVEFAADTSAWELDGVNGRIEIKDTAVLPVDQMYYLKYQYYLIANSPYIYGEDMNPFINGLRITVHNDPLAPDHTNSGWIEDSNTNYKVISMRYPNQGVEVPYDFGVLVTDDFSSTSYNGKKPARFQVINLTLNEPADYIFEDVNKDSSLSNSDKITPITFVGRRARGTWQMRFLAPRDSIVLVDSLDENGYAVEDKEGEVIKIPVDTVFVEKRDPVAGDKFVLKIRKPFISKDVYSFKTKRSSIDFGLAKENLKQVAVVPNPYVGASEFETKPNLQSGRGDRLIYFIHLPAQCTIRIYTLSGELVKSIEHDTVNEDGSEEWNMLSKHNMDIAFGIYIYHVDAPGIGEHIGKFAVLK
ncbi:hypothetical protein KAH55_01465, partial [bacterium]|nr:hypothetical protein [bacterium]